MLKYFINIKELKRFKIRIIILISVVFILFGVLYSRTGILQTKKIDERDLALWEYDNQGVIKNAKEFTLEGKNETCWYLIHGYTSTPDEMRTIAEEIKREFNDTVVVTRLKGHGEVPSHILDLNLDDWYNQVSAEFDALQNKCEKVNLIGFSFGGALSTRLAETKNVNNVYLLSPYLFATYNYYQVFKLEVYVDLFTDVFNYVKKTTIGQINSPEGLEQHIAYWNMPFEPVKNSKPFFEKTKLNLDKIKAPVLLQQSKNDKTSNIKSSIFIHENISSENKKLVIFEKSNHIIPEDYDQKDVIANIINFEQKTRK